jgi:predicted nucleic acid-binding protein
MLAGFVCIYSDRHQSSGLRTSSLSLEQALARVQSWLDQAGTRVIRPTEQHWAIFQLMLRDGQAVANLVTDAHLAAPAVEHGCDLASTDSDFARFPKLKWINPFSL